MKKSMYIPKMKQLRSFILWTAIFFLNAESYCNDLIKNTQIHGFVSQGYLKSSKMNYLYNSINGTSDVREIGMTFHTRISDRLRFGWQVLSRDYGQVGNNKAYIDWAFFDYQINGLSGIRAGKVKIPLGLYNEERDTDFLRPMAFLPQGLYNEQIRDQLVAYTGIGLYGGFPLASGNLKYNLYAGQSKWDSDSRVIEYLQNQWNTDYNSLIKPYLDYLGYSQNLTLDHLKGDNKNVFGGRVDWLLPEAGARLSYSHMVHNDNLIDETGVEIGDFKTKSWQILSLEWVFDRFTFATEYSKRNIYIDLFQEVNQQIGMDIIPVLVEEPDQRMFYTLFNYQINEQLSVSFLYDKTTSGRAEEKVAGGSVMIDRSAGMRYDVNSRWTLKLEHHNLSGFNLFFNVYLFNRNGHNPEIFKEWSFWIAKVSYNF